MLLALGVLVLLLALLVVGALGYLRSEAGGALVRAQAAQAVNRAILGRLELGRARLDGDTVVLEDVKLFTPEGELVAEVKRLEAQGDLPALLRGKLRLRRAKVEAPGLYLVRDARGLNLSRAIAARAPAKDQGGVASVFAEVKALALTGGTVSYRDDGRQVRVENFRGQGGATVRTAPLEVTGRFEGAADLGAPFEAKQPLALRLGASSPKKGAVVADLALEGGGLKLAAAFDSGALALDVRQLDLPEAWGRAFFAEAWPKGALHLVGKASPRGADLRAGLGEGGKARVRATYDLAASRLDAVDLEVEALDLAALREGLPKTRLDAAAKGSLADFRPATLTGKLEGRASWKTPDGARVADLTAALEAVGGVVKVDPVRAEMPGGSLLVKGEASAAKLDLKGRLLARDLGLAVETLTTALGAEPLGLSGFGRLDVRVAGPVLGPTVTLEGKVPWLTFGALAALRVDVAASMPDLRRPREVDARLGIGTLSIGEYTLEQVRLGLETQGRNVALDVSSKGLTALVARAKGRLEGESAMALATLALEWPGTTWTMEGTSRVSWEQGVDLAPLRLRADRQALDVEAHQRPEALSARLGLTDLDLARLPAALVPAKLGLGGLVNGTVEAQGRPRNPQVTARVTLRGGKVRTVEGIDADVEASLDQGRAKGTLGATTALGKAAGTFDLPLAWGKAKSEAPLALALQLEDLSLAEVLAAAAQPPWLEGALRLGLTLQGTVAAPRLALDASTAGAVFKPGQGRADVPIERAVARVETRPDGTAVAQVDVAALGAALALNLASPLTVADALFRTPDLEALRALDFTAEATLTGLAVPAVKELLPEALASWQGTLALTAQARGPAASPALAVQARVADLSSPDFRPVQVAFDFSGTPRDTRAKLEVTAKDKLLVALEGVAQVPLIELGADAVNADRGFRLDGNVGPIDLTEVSALRGDTKGAVSGQVRASFGGSGTLGAPKLGLRGSLEGLKRGKVALGKANLGWDHQAARNVLTLGLVSTNGGQLRLDGELALDLGLAALRKGLDLQAAPLKAKLASRGFDLAFLSGAHAAVRTVGGQLTADAKVDGTVGDPRFDGTLQWTRGRLGLAGLSELRELELKVKADNAHASIDQLEAKSGAGTLSLSGETHRAGGEVWAFTGKLETRRFPLVTDDQLRALVDLRLTLAGEATEKLWNVREVKIPEAHVELPDVRKKDIQALDRPKDIVLVRDGVALGPRPRRWKQAADEAVAAALQKQRARVIRAVLVAPNNLWVKSTDVNVELGLGDGFTVEYDQQVLLSGDVRVQRGKVDVIGRHFEIQKDSSVRFSGAPSEPYLNITALYKNEREQVTVFATLVGKGTHFAFRTSSQPPLSESEIFSLLATGRRSLKRGSGSAISGEQAVSVLGAYAARELKAALAQKLPIDLLDVLSIEAGSDGFRGARVEAGKYLSDRLYLGYIGQLGADPRKGENRNAGRIEYLIAPRLTVEATAGDAPAGGADLVWGLDF